MSRSTNSREDEKSVIALEASEMEQIDSMGLSTEDREHFKDVLRNIRLDRVAQLASNTRRKGHVSLAFETKYGRYTTSNNIPCEINPQAVCGSFNIIFKIRFEDGLCWMLKVPQNGHKSGFDSLAAQSLISEALTMRLIKRETRIRVPKVYAFDATVNNEIGCPFILMQCVDAKPLAEYWYSNTTPQEQLEDFRAATLEDIAKAMLQLTTLTFSQGGALEFDTTGQVVGVGASRVLDFPAEYERYKQGGERHAAFPFCKRDCMVDPQAFVLFLADRSKCTSNLSDYDEGLDQLLRVLSNWLFEQEPDRNTGNDFVLSHPDLDTQNILISPEGQLTFIDWDGVVAVPRSVGCLKYPLWLMASWDALNYRYNEEARKWKNRGFEESSPKKLAHYRSMYAKYMESALFKAEASGSSVTGYDAAFTRRSLMAWALENSAKSVENMQGNLCHIFDKVKKATEGWDDDAIGAFLAARQSDEGDKGIPSLADLNTHGISNTTAPAGRPVRPLRGARRPILATLKSNIEIRSPKNMSQKEKHLLEMTAPGSEFSAEIKGVSTGSPIQAPPASHEMDTKFSLETMPSIKVDEAQTDNVRHPPPRQRALSEASDLEVPTSTKPSPESVSEAKCPKELKPERTEQSVPLARSCSTVERIPAAKSVETMASAPKQQPLPFVADHHDPSEKLLPDTTHILEVSSGKREQSLRNNSCPFTKSNSKSKDPTKKSSVKARDIKHALLSTNPRPRTYGSILEPLVDLTPAQIYNFKPSASRGDFDSEEQPLNISAAKDSTAKASTLDKYIQHSAIASSTVISRCGVTQILSWIRKKMRKWSARGSPAVLDRGPVRCQESLNDPENTYPNPTIVKDQPVNADAVAATPIQPKDNASEAAAAIVNQDSIYQEINLKKETSIHIAEDAFTPIVNDDGKVYGVKFPCECDPAKTTAHLQHVSISSGENTTEGAKTTNKSAPSSFTRISFKGHPLACYGQLWDGPKIWDVNEVEKLMDKCREYHSTWIKKTIPEKPTNERETKTQDCEEPKEKGKGIKSCSTRFDAQGPKPHQRRHVRNHHGNTSEVIEPVSNDRIQASDPPRHASKIFANKSFAPLLHAIPRHPALKDQKPPNPQSSSTTIDAIDGPHEEQEEAMTDNGEFTLEQIAMALHTGSLDVKRRRRLKAGFLGVLERG